MAKVNSGFPSIANLSKLSFVVPVFRKTFSTLNPSFSKNILLRIERHSILLTVKLLFEKNMEYAKANSYNEIPFFVAPKILEGKNSFLD